MSEFVAATLSVVVVVGAAIWLALIIEGPVAASRVREFSHRKQVPLTDANSAAVMRYLGTTRRWRSAGVVVGLSYGLAAAWQQRVVSVNAATVFLGWFVGAMVAEWRFGLASEDERRVANLARRRGSEYVGRLRLMAPAVPFVSIIVATIGDLASDQSAERHLAAALSVVVGVVVIGAGLAVGRHVLTRPQPASLDESVVAADDVLRRTSLRVVNGAVFALLAGVLAQTLVLSTLDSSSGWAVVVVVVGAVGGVLLAGPILGPSQLKVAPPEVVAA
jgi:hypothetical protein